MKQEPVRGDPNQGICISLEKVEDLNDNSEVAFQWKCSCWSTNDEFLLEWNINVPKDLLRFIPNGDSLLVSQLGFFKYNDMVYVLVAWTRRYMWVYCHDIKSFTEMHSQGINISVEPKVYNLELEEDQDTEDQALLKDQNDHSVSLAIRTGDGEFQFVISTSTLKLHTLRITVSGEIAQVLGFSMSSNWWDIAKFNENIFQSENQNSDSSIFCPEFEKESKSHLKSIVGLLKSAWNSSERIQRSKPRTAKIAENTEDFDDYSEYTRPSEAPIRTPFDRRKGVKKLRKTTFNEDILIFSFPSSYIKWNVSFMCFITAEIPNTLNGKKTKILILFRHDSFGVVELCWTLNFNQIGDFYPSNLIAIPCFENTDTRNHENSISTMKIHLEISLGDFHKFALFFIYKSNNSLKLLQLTPTSSLLPETSEATNPLLSWTHKPSFNMSLLHEIMNISSFASKNDNNCFSDICNLEQNIQLVSSPQAQDIFLYQKSSLQPGITHKCILCTNKHIFIIYITENGHQLICKNILDHSNQSNKIYFTTYSQNTLYLLVNYQDIPLKIDLSSPYNNESQEYLNNINNTENEATGESIGNSNFEFNQLILKYRGLRNGEISKVDNIFGNSNSESMITNLEMLHKQIISDFKLTKLGCAESSINSIKYTKILSMIGQNLNNRILSNNFEALDEEATLLLGKCSFLLDLDYWKDINSIEDWKELSEGTCFDQITSKFPSLQSFLIKYLDPIAIISSN
ncbi:hypothetical protein [Cryptosporidium parvum Iowa II]|uniref:Uncharacterized protein n=2 Tax=Cryptosporidium parvum TaxID=5807 RepID=Q5CSD2_CRYPI|nr:hypothetical protein [Cryptosporidium parvum Iowa II]EAK88329.1 hypothetical protein cgd1_3190 [Cryptosporidium parvum Iowa II]WRK30715.1 Uncharacterized protein cpbgf_1003190 [Cryptosporidium parvum]